MTTEKETTLIKCLIDLIQLDIDAVLGGYAPALEHIKNKDIHAKLVSFKKDHERHIKDLSDVVKILGGTPPELTKDFKGFMIQGMTALQSIFGEHAALKAMQTNEKLTNSTYKKALQENLPEDVRTIVQLNYQDEQMHLAYIEEQLQRMDKEADSHKNEEKS